METNRSQSSNDIIATGTTDTTLSLNDTTITTIPLMTIVNSGNASVDNDNPTTYLCVVKIL